jgi:hypothetical protein
VKSIYILTIIFLVSLFSVNALTLEAGEILFDGTYEYAVKDRIVIDSLEVTNGEIYINGDAFCSSPYNSRFTTTRSACPIISPSSSGSINYDVEGMIQDKLLLEEQKLAEAEEKDSSSGGSEGRLIDYDFGEEQDEILYDDVTAEETSAQENNFFLKFVRFMSDSENRAKVSLVVIVVSLFGITLISLQKIKYTKEGYKHIHTKDIDVETKTIEVKKKK